MALVVLTGFLKTSSPNGPFASNRVLRLKTTKTVSKVAIIKTKRATISFFLFSWLFLFLLSFSFVAVIVELLGFKKHAL